MTQSNGRESLKSDNHNIIKIVLFIEFDSETSLSISVTT